MGWGDSGEEEEKGEDRNEGTKSWGSGSQRFSDGMRFGFGRLIRDEHSPPSLRGVFVSVFLLRGGGLRRWRQR